MDTDFTVKSLPISEQPYEKFKLRGAGSLSDAELLAVILRTGIKGKSITSLANNIISLCDNKGGIGYLGRLSYEELLNIDGIGFVKAAQLKCLGEFCYRMWEQNREDLKKYNTANEIAAYFSQYFKGMEKEETWMMLFDSKNHLIKKSKLSLGTLNAAILSSREVFREALLSNAAGIVLIHNHPSGDPEPSTEDRLITNQIEKAGFLVDIPLIDHIIITGSKYYSFKEAGYIA